MYLNYHKIKEFQFVYMVFVWVIEILKTTSTVIIKHKARPEVGYKLCHDYSKQIIIFQNLRSFNFRFNKLRFWSFTNRTFIILRKLFEGCTYRNIRSAISV